MFVGMPGEKPQLLVMVTVEVWGDWGTRVGEWGLNVPPEYEQKRPPRCAPRPGTVRRVDTVFAARELSEEEFRQWWEWAKTRIPPLAGTPKEHAAGDYLVSMGAGRGRTQDVGHPQMR